VTHARTVDGVGHGPESGDCIDELRVFGARLLGAPPLASLSPAPRFRKRSRTAPPHGETRRRGSSARPDKRAPRARTRASSCVTARRRASGEPETAPPEAGS
jgi:hypothetical protein